MNPFTEGQKVVCINESFPHIEKYGGVDLGNPNPIKGEELIIAEILGLFLRFDKYTFPNENKWFLYNRFAPITDWEEQLVENLLESVKEYI